MRRVEAVCLCAPRNQGIGPHVNQWDFALTAHARCPSVRTGLSNQGPQNCSVISPVAHRGLTQADRVYVCNDVPDHPALHHFMENYSCSQNARTIWRDDCRKKTRKRAAAARVSAMAPSSSIARVQPSTPPSHPAWPMPEPTMACPDTRISNVEVRSRTSSRFRSIPPSKESRAGEGDPWARRLRSGRRRFRPVRGRGRDGHAATAQTLVF